MDDDTDPLPLVLALFDPSSVPWETELRDWALYMRPDGTARVWIEHALVFAFAGGVGFDVRYVEVFQHLGRRIHRLLDERPGVAALDGMVRPLNFTGYPDIPVRLGRFGGEMFLFLAKPGCEE